MVSALFGLVSEMAASMLPSGYLPLDYLESTGAQYIDTGISATTDMAATIDWLSTKKDGANFQVFFGAVNVSVGNIQMLTVLIGKDQPLQGGIFNSSTLAKNNGENVLWGAGDRHTVVLDARDGTLKFDGETVLTQTATTQPVADLPLYLFARHSSTGVAQNYASGRLYACTISTNDVPARDFVPALRLSDGTYGLYDRVSDGFFENQGNGDGFKKFWFTVDRADLELRDYLESVTTNGFIDTGVVSKTNMVVDVDWLSKKVNGESFQVPLGVRLDSSSSQMFGFYVNGANKLAAAMFGPAEAGLIPWNENARHQLRFDAANMKLYADGYPLYTFTNEVTTIDDATCYLFARNNSDQGKAASGAKGRLYSSRFLENGEVKHEFLPAILVGSSLPGLYDRIDRKFFVADTNNFTIGTNQWNYGYRELDYVQSHGTEYVDLGFVANSNTVVEVDYMSLKQKGVSFQVLFGSAVNSSVRYVAYIGSANPIVVSTYGSNVDTGLPNWSYGERKVFKLDPVEKKVHVGENEYDVSSMTYVEQTKAGNLYLFWRSNENSESCKAQGRLYAAKVWQDGELIRDLIPVCRKADGAAMLYDRVFGVYYPNAGTGAFTYPRQGLMIIVM